MTALFDDLRGAWGARAPKTSPTFVSPANRTEFMVHWNGGPTGLTAASPHSRCLAVVKADQNFHMDGRGWNDIGYNGLVCPHARAIECRGIDYAGAHCPNHNTSAYGWQFAIGQGELVTPAMFDRMARARADCSARSGHALTPMGHRDGFATSCPGDQAEAWVKAGMPGTTAVPTPTKDWFDMATLHDLETAAATGVLSATIGRSGLTVGVVLERLYASIGLANARDVAQTAAIQALAQSKGVDPAAIKTAVDDALAAYTLTITKGA